MKKEKMTIEEFKEWVEVANELGVKIIFGPGSKAPEEFKELVKQKQTRKSTHVYTDFGSGQESANPWPDDDYGQ